MKKTAFFLLLAVAGLVACNDNWDDYYETSSQSGSVDTTTATTVLDCTIAEFFETHTEYSEFYNLLDTVGATESLNADQELTLWVVTDSVIKLTKVEYTEPGTSLETDTARFKYHVNYLSVNRNQLKNGARLKTLNGIYIQLTIAEDGTVYANDSKLIETFRLNNGVVHVIDAMMVPRLNLYAYIEQLSDDYSIFRDSIMSYSEKVFDVDKSTPLAVDKTGNTIYDSVFVTYNPMFDTVRFDSEFEQFTCFIPSNEVMIECYRKLNETYQAIGRPYVGVIDKVNKFSEADTFPYLAQKDIELAINWVKRAAFYEGTFGVTEATAPDVYSAFDRQWKNFDQNGDAVQKIDTENPEDLSNGRVFFVKEMKIPTNVVITRLKQFLYHYEKFSDPNDVAKYFCIKGATKVSVSAGDEIPTLAIQAGQNSPAWAEYTYTYFHEQENSSGKMTPRYTYLSLNSDETQEGEFSISFSPVTPTGWNSATEYKIPAGEYTLYLGFRAKAMCTGNVWFATADTDNESNSLTVLPDGDVQLMSNYKLIATNIDFTAATPWNYDRAEGGEMVQYSNGKNRWNSNGGKVGTVLVEGEGMRSVRIKVQYVSGEKTMQVYHWCLIPTENNY